ncbi:hypothetical protein [Mycoplasmopsis maculosa]|nr:hypothetical protein [Mycoplasmopsis maculosa]
MPSFFFSSNINSKKLGIENYNKTNNIKNLAKDKIALSYLIIGNNE